jgi:hypothetical protein
MGDLKPLGSEKLNGMDKINRIMEIARYKETPKQSINELSTTNYTITLPDGNIYAIVKEKLGYVIKSGLNESTLDYVNHMRHRKHYRSYSEAMKKLNLMASEVNRVSGFEENISLIGEQTDVKKKFILKLPNTSKTKPTVEEPATPPPAEDMSATPPAPDAMGMGDMGVTPPTEGMGGEMPPAPDAMGMGDMGTTPPPPPGGDMGIEDMSGEVPPSPEDELGGIGDEESDDEEPQGPTGLKSIQKLTGRLSQKLRSFEKEKGLDSQDIKYVLNSIISALELENLDEDDKDDIISKFDGSDEYGEEGAGELDLSSEEMPDDDFGIGSSDEMSTPPPSNEPPMVESKVDKLIKSYFKITEEEKPILEEKKKKEFLKKKIQYIETKNEIRNLSESVKQMSKSLNLFESDAKFIGKTNKENLVFVKNGKQIRVTPIGKII